MGEDETFIASDATPIVGYTDQVIYLKDNEIGVIRRGEPVQMLSLFNNEPSTINIQKLKLSLAQLEKEAMTRSCLKKFSSSPSTLRDCLRGRIVDNCRRVTLSGVDLNQERFKSAERITLVACGTSWHAALIGKRLIQDFCKMPVEVEYASEFRYGNPVLNEKDIVISISQSGETADTLAAIELAKSQGCVCLWHLQRGRSIHSPHHRFRNLHSRRSGDRRRINQSLHRSGDSADAARSFRGPAPRGH